MIWPEEQNISVWPSGAALATSCDISVPPAAGLFSTITGWPQAACSFSATMRAIASGAPPSTMRISRVG